MVHVPPFHVCLKLRMTGRKSTLGLGSLSTKVRPGSHRASDVALLTMQGLCSRQAREASKVSLGLWPQWLPINDPVGMTGKVLSKSVLPAQIWAPGPRLSARTGL